MKKNWIIGLAAAGAAAIGAAIYGLVKANKNADEECAEGEYLTPDSTEEVSEDNVVETNE